LFLFQIVTAEQRYVLTKNNEVKVTDRQRRLKLKLNQQHQIEK